MTCHLRSLFQTFEEIEKKHNLRDSFINNNNNNNRYIFTCFQQPLNIVYLLEWRFKCAFIGAHSSNYILANYLSFSQANECFNAHIRAFI